MPPAALVPELESLHLEGFDETTGAPESRLSDVTKAHALYVALLHADEGSAANRARLDAMFDGAPPFDRAKLAATAQANRINLNFGQGQRLLDVAMSAYVDLYSSLETLVEVKGTLGDPVSRPAMEAIVSRELTHQLRAWPEFHAAYLRLCTIFVKHGVAVAYFDSPKGWRFRVGGLQDVLVPRQTTSTECSPDVFIARRPYQVHELYSFIKNEKSAARVGWNVAEVRRVLAKGVTSTSPALNGSSEFESLQAELKNNDVCTGYQNPSVRTLHFWVREFDGSVSHMICAENEPKEFLYRKTSRFKSPERAYTFFTCGVGTNGTLHSVRGLGHRIHAHVHVSNRLRCQLVEGAMLASQAIVQPENQRALDQLSFTTWGPFSVLSPDVKLVERAVPNLSNSVQPALEDVTRQLELNTDTVSPYGPNQSSPYRNQMQVVSDLDVTTRLSGATLNLFYASWSRLLREVVRRIIEEPGGKAKADLIRRCEAQGVPGEFIMSLDLDRTRAVRSIGNGSAANRTAALREMQALMGQFDEVGRRHLVRDIVASRVGHDLADRYAPETADPRPTADVKIAMLENSLLSRGEEVPVVDGEMHGAHLEQHIPVLEQLVAAFNEGTLDPQESLQTFQSYYTHISQHAQRAAADPALQGMAGSIKKLLNFAEEIIHNASKAIQKQQRLEGGEGDPESGTGEQGPGSREALLQTRLEEHRARLAIAREKADLEMAIKREKFEQERALADARNALRMSNSPV